VQTEKSIPGVKKIVEVLASHTVEGGLFFMYRRPILCTLYGAVDFLTVLKKGCWGGGVLLVHNEIHYVPIGDGWEEVLVCNV
jgi:hypothetical protein